ncbi:MAG: hypothetical protein RLZ17_408, partial [Actinomycetota bacterium]
MGLFSRKENANIPNVSVDENWPFDAPGGFVV